MRAGEKIYLTPTPVRIWHWLNALGIVTLCVTGAEIRFPEYVQVFGSYKAAVRLHNTAGIVVALSYLMWFVYYAFVARSLIKTYVPTAKDILGGMVRQALYYFFYFFLGNKPNPHHQTPENKFNPLQKASYMVIMFILTPLVIVTGILLMNVVPLRAIVLVIGGLKVMVAVHWLLACAFCAFLFIHIYLATMGHTPFAHIKPMWTGWEEIEPDMYDEEAEAQPKVADETSNVLQLQKEKSPPHLKKAAGE